MALLFLAIPLAFWAFFISIYSEPTGILYTIPWIPQLGIHFSFAINKLSLFAGLLISFIGAAITFYSSQYMVTITGQYRFWTFFSTFMLSMLGLVLSENLITLFLFWEATSICSFFLIGHYHDDQKTRKSALNSLLVTGGSGIFLLIGFIGLGILGGSYEITSLIANKETILAHPSIGLVFAFIMIGAMAKSAQFPFHLWLPQAMTGPAPVSAFLHSATMVKAGIFLLARLFPLLGDLPYWEPVLVSVGLITFIWGGLVAIRHFDIKAILANTTISALGCLVALLGMGKSYPKALEAFLLFFIAHALYKATLFMCAGIIEKKFKKKDLRQLRMNPLEAPYLTISLVAGCFSMMGLPTTIGFVAKETFLEFSLDNLFYLVPLMIGSLLNFVAAGKILDHLLLSKRPYSEIGYESNKFFMALSPFILSLITLSFAFFGSFGVDEFAKQFIGEFTQEPVNVAISLWHGFNLPLVLSVLIMICGSLIVFSMRKHLHALEDSELAAWAPTRLFDSLFELLLTKARIFNSFYQSGYLRRYFLTIFISSSLFIFLGFLYFRPSMDVPLSSINFLDICIGLIIVFSTVSTLVTDSKIWAVTQIGIVGTCFILFFIIYGAPDLALTQLLVEIFTLTIFVFALHRLPKLRRYSSRKSRLRDLVVSICFGVLMGLLSYFSFSPSLEKSVASFYAENAYLAAYGKNIVNVILVDFRSFDTLGEVSVILMAAIGVYILMRKRGGANE